MATKAEQAVLDAAEAWAEAVLDAEQHGGEHQAAVATTAAILFEAAMAAKGEG